MEGDIFSKSYDQDLSIWPKKKQWIQIHFGKKRVLLRSDCNIGWTIKNPADLIRKHPLQTFPPLLKEEKSENFWLIVRLFLLSHIACNEAQTLRPAFCNLHQSHWWNLSASICWDLISSICVARVVGFPMAGFSIFSICPVAGVCPQKKRDWIEIGI